MLGKATEDGQADGNTSAMTDSGDKVKFLRFHGRIPVWTGGRSLWISAPPSAFKIVHPCCA